MYIKQAQKVDRPFHNRLEVEVTRQFTKKPCQRFFDVYKLNDAFGLPHEVISIMDKYKQQKKMSKEPTLTLSETETLE